MQERPLQKHHATLRIHCTCDAGSGARGLAEGDSAATHMGGGHNLGGIHAEDAVDAGGNSAGGSSDVSSVTGIGTVWVAVWDPRTRPTGPLRPGYHPSPPRQS